MVDLRNLGFEVRTLCLKVPNYSDGIIIIVMV